MSTQLATIDAALGQLRASLASIEDEMFGSQLKLTASVLGNAVTSAREGVNPARVGDIEFALNDLVAVVDQLSAADADRVLPTVKTIQAEVGRLKQAASLPADLISNIKALQSKLRDRRAAIERQAYAAAGAAGPLPHPPAELRTEATRLRERLIAAGFTVPALDALIEAREEFRLHSVNDLMNELDVVLG